MIKSNKYNAKKCEYNGIEFDSKLEMYTYQLFTDNGFHIERCVKPFILLEGFTHYDILSGKIRKKRNIVYTPDFFLTVDNMIVVIECKGFVARDFPLRLKMFLSRYNYPYIQIKSQKHAREVLQVLKSKYNVV